MLTVLTVLKVLTVLMVLTVLAVLAVLTVLTVLAVLPWVVWVFRCVTLSPSWRIGCCRWVGVKVGVKDRKVLCVSLYPILKGFNPILKGFDR